MDQFSSLFFDDSSKKSLAFQNISFSSLFNPKSYKMSPKKIIISPKKAQKTMRENHFQNPQVDLDFKDLCKKLDFSEASENASNYSISENENMEINEVSSEDLTEMKNASEFSWVSSNSLTKIKPKKKSKKCPNSDKNLTFINVKRNFDDSLDSSFSKFEEEYIIIKTICRGEMGTVYLCLRLKDKKKFAVKKTKFFSHKYDYDNMNKFVKEIERYSIEPESQFILKYIDFWLEENSSSEKKNYKNNFNIRDMFIVTDYYPKGNLKEYIINLKKNFKEKISYKLIWDIIFQMIVPVNFLHKLGYVHYDIKPTNYLIMDNNQLLLNDFCLSIKEEEIKQNELEGDSVYISPELFYKNVGTISHKTDIYSLGLSILEILIDEELPKNGKIWQEMRNREISNIFIDKICLIDNDYVQRNKLINLIGDMTKINSNERPELDFLLNDVNKYPELFNRYNSLKIGKYEKNILVDYINIYNNTPVDIYKKEDENNLCSKEINGNINKIFYKRSNSMENLI